MRKIALISLLLNSYLAPAQYAPQAGLAGSTAVSASSSDIVGWASGCIVNRGYIDIANQSLGYVTGGDASNGVGASDGAVVSLGDSGVAVLSFPSAIYNGPGPDFAVFENGFIDPANPSAAFLELAFVEVSSDGINYFRFPSHSNTPTNTQIPGSGVYMDATLINNLAGKYISHFGTPFDLEELSGISELDIDNITHVRLIDVVGSTTTHTTFDDAGTVINDPYPTNFPTGGFDLDAVGVMHRHSTIIKSELAPFGVSVYPNPVKDRLYISLNNKTTNELHLSLTSSVGQTVLQSTISGEHATINIAEYPAGMYYLAITDTNGKKWVGKILKY